MQKCIEAEAMERFFVDSVSEPGVQRECILWDNGRWTCSCPWGTRNLEPDKKDCRHIQQAKRQLVERELAETLKRLRTDMEHWAVPEASMVRILGDLSREVLCGPADRARLTREREIAEWLEECDAADKEKRRFQISLQRYAEKISRAMTVNYPRLKP